MKLGFLISGGGTTFKNLDERMANGSLAAEVACVISSSAKAAGLAYARDRGYPSATIARARFADDASFSAAVNAELQRHGVELVILAGYLKRYLPGNAYAMRTLNIHPSLIPAFCGQGYYGMKVHQAVWERGCKVSGCTVHLVNDAYDAGPIVLQRTVTLADKDTPDTIREKVFEAEREAYPDAIRYFVEKRITLEQDRVLIR